MYLCIYTVGLTVKKIKKKFKKSMTQSHLFLALKFYEPIIKPHVVSVIQRFKSYLMCCKFPVDLQPEMYLRIRSCWLRSRECSTCYKNPLAPVYQQHTLLKRGGWTHLWLKRKTHTNIRTGWHLSAEPQNLKNRVKRRFRLLCDILPGG